MHFKSFAWAKNESIPTIKSKNSKNKVVGSIDGLLSPIDQLKLNKMYDCILQLATTVDCPVSTIGVGNPCIRILEVGCYCLVKERKTRAEAEQFCKDPQMQLVGLESKSESEEVFRLMDENELEGFWTSGVDKELNGKWVWEQPASYSVSSPVKFFEWCKGNPDNFDGNDFYILVKKQPDGINCWEDTPGDARWPTICKPSLSVNNLMDNLSKLSLELKVAFKTIEKLEKENHRMMELNQISFNNVLNEFSVMKKSCCKAG